MTLTEEIKAQKNVELRKRVYRALQSMYRLFRGSPADTAIIDRYMNIWKPLTGNIQDVVIFPYESKAGIGAEKKNVTHCLFAMVTTMIKKWHCHCKDDNSTDYISSLEAQLDKIELAVKLWPNLQVRGSDVTGYYLRMLKGE